jgi:hypothetical protein
LVLSACVFGGSISSACVLDDSITAVL